MNLKNYTSGVPAAKSVAMIEHLLVQLGAERIHKGYIGGNLKSISFSIKVGENVIPFQLPANVDAIDAYLLNQYRRSPNNTQRENARAQAERTAWKLMYEWVHIQASMIEMNQAEFIEVFLPYAYRADKDKTFFELLKGEGYKQLMP